MSEKKNKKKRRDGGDGVEELLRAAEDELLLNLTVDSHMSRVSPSYIDADLDRRFQALKSSSSTSAPLPLKPKREEAAPPVPKIVEPPQDYRRDLNHADLLSRFSALKGTISDNDDDHNDDDEEDEVEKVIRWAMDAVRLENSPPTNPVAPENGKSIN